MSKETKFEWTDELVKEYQGFRFWKTEGNKIDMSEEEIIRQFIQSKSIPNKQESKEDLVAAFIEKYRYDHTMTSHRIAAHITGKFNTVPDISLKYTQSEVDTIREDLWNRCREWADGQWSNQFFPDGKNSQFKYPTLQDYLQSINKKKEQETIVTNNDDVACLSLNDLLDVWDDDLERNKRRTVKKSFMETQMYKRFEQKVKEKLKQ